MEIKLQENARLNVNKTIRCLVRNKIKHRKKYKIGKSPTPLVSEISLSCTPPVLDSIFLLIKKISIFFSFLLPLCDMQVNRISMESAKCAQSNKICRQSEIWYLFAEIRVKGQIVTFYCFCNE